MIRMKNGHYEEDVLLGISFNPTVKSGLLAEELYLRLQKILQGERVPSIANVEKRIPVDPNRDELLGSLWHKYGESPVLEKNFQQTEKRIVERCQREKKEENRFSIGPFQIATWLLNKHDIFLSNADDIAAKYGEYTIFYGATVYLCIKIPSHTSIIFDEQLKSILTNLSKISRKIGNGSVNAVRIKNADAPLRQSLFDKGAIEFANRPLWVTHELSVPEDGMHTPDDRYVANIYEVLENAGTRCMLGNEMIDLSNAPIWIANRMYFRYDFP